MVTASDSNGSSRMEPTLEEVTMKAAQIACLVLIAPIWLGCAHETTVTTRTSECIEPDFVHDADDHECGRLIEKVSVTTQHDGCHGVISCTFVVAGEVISLPFRVVGAAFEVVF